MTSTTPTTFLACMSKTQPAHGGRWLTLTSCFPLFIWITNHGAKELDIGKRLHPSPPMTLPDRSIKLPDAELAALKQLANDRGAELVRLELRGVP